jgi:predicted nuclease of predicted toxin-antitoxin system
MRILTDENVPQSVLTWLRATGHDVTSASELGIGAPDTRWLSLAESEQRLILTSDKDFGELVFRDRLTTFGIILLRLDDIAVPAWMTRLQEVWSVVEANPSSCFIVVTSQRVRVRRLS